MEIVRGPETAHEVLEALAVNRYVPLVGNLSPVNVATPATQFRATAPTPVENFPGPDESERVTSRVVFTVSPLGVLTVTAMEERFVPVEPVEGIEVNTSLFMGSPFPAWEMPDGLVANRAADLRTALMRGLEVGFLGVTSSVRSIPALRNQLLGVDMRLPRQFVPQGCESLRITMPEPLHEFNDFASTVVVLLIRRHGFFSSEDEAEDRSTNRAAMKINSHSPDSR